MLTRLAGELETDVSVLLGAKVETATEENAIVEQLSELDDVTYRAMMSEYSIYYHGKVVGGIYDDRFLVKPTKSVIDLMPTASMELTYEGAKEMLLVEDVDNREFLRELLEVMYPELPAPKKRK